MQVKLPLCLLSVFIFSSALQAESKNPYPADWFWGKPEQRKVLDAMIGKPAPTISLSSWKNGELDAAKRKGKIVVVDFWATWCGPCIASIPKNNSLHKKYKDKGVEILGICTSSGQEKMDSVVSKKGMKYPTAKDPSSKTAKAWKVGWYPTYAVIGRDGNVVCSGLRPSAVEKVIQDLLKK